MRNFIKDHRFLAGLLSIFISVFLVSIVAYAATTIGTNINTAGTVTMESASTTNDFWLGNVIADDDDSLFFDASSTEWLMWDDDPGEFDLSDDLNIDGGATSTFVWIGSGGTANNIDMSNDLYVQGDAEIDGSLWVDSATTTDSLAVGGYASSTGNLNTQGNLHVGGNTDVDGTLVVGQSGSTITNYTFGTCDFVDTSITASSTEVVFCNNATGVASGDNIYVTATSSFETNYIIQTASSTAANVIQVRVLNLGLIEDTTLGGTTLNWQSIR